MLGEAVEDVPRGRRPERPRGAPAAATPAAPRGPRPARSARSSTTSRSTSTRARSSASSRSRARARTSCSTSWPGSERPDGGELLVDGTPVSFRHPADAIRAGLVYVPADRAEALLMQRSVRENIALPFSAAHPRAGA